MTRGTVIKRRNKQARAFAPPETFKVKSGVRKKMKKDNERPVLTACPNCGRYPVTMLRSEKHCPKCERRILRSAFSKVKEKLSK